MSNNILVIGAVNVDIFASTLEQYTLEDSNIASINLGFGGVGGNIATNLNILNQKVSFLTAFSNDILGKFVSSHYSDLQIDVSASLISKRSNASVYLGVMDENNDLFLGLNDMKLIEELNADYLKTKHEYINQFDFIVIDTNLNQDTLTYLLKTYQHKHIFMDAVSAEKVTKLEKLLPYISTLKCNQLELAALSDKQTIEKQIEEVLSGGVTELLITNKANPVIYASKNLQQEFSFEKEHHIVNATGAGDAFISGYVKGFINNDELDQRITCAITLARATLKVPTSTLEKGEFTC